ncbi:unnamed protein product [Ectocarpus fasciculatus]
MGCGAEVWHVEGVREYVSCVQPCEGVTALQCGLICMYSCHHGTLRYRLQIPHNAVRYDLTLVEKSIDRAAGRECDSEAVSRRMGESSSCPRSPALTGRRSSSSRSTMSRSTDGSSATTMSTSTSRGSGERDIRYEWRSRDLTCITHRVCCSCFFLCTAVQQ